MTKEALAVCRSFLDGVVIFYFLWWVVGWYAQSFLYPTTVLRLCYVLIEVVTTFLPPSLLKG